MKLKNLNSWFSIIEVMIAIFIFAMWMASIFMLIQSSLNLNHLNKNHIIASNLAREWIEIVRNIRDYNYETYHKYNWIPNSWNNYDSDNYFQTWTYYKVENDFSNPNYPFILDKSWNQSFSSDPKQDFKDWDFDNYKLYLNSDNKYTYKSFWTDNTIFYRFIYFDDLLDDSWNPIPDTMKLRSKVIWNSKWYHEFEIDTVLADFNRY